MWQVLITSSNSDVNQQVTTAVVRYLHQIRRQTLHLTQKSTHHRPAHTVSTQILSILKAKIQLKKRGQLKLIN